MTDPVKFGILYVLYRFRSLLVTRLREFVRAEDSVLNKYVQEFIEQKLLTKRKVLTCGGVFTVLSITERGAEMFVRCLELTRHC